MYKYLKQILMQNTNLNKLNLIKTIYHNTNINIIFILKLNLT